jgi:hypothetical protein
MTTVQNFRLREKRHLLRAESGIEFGYAEESGDVARATRPMGFGDVVAPVFGIGKLGVAICAVDRELKLFLGNLCVDLFEPGVRITRRTIFPLIKRFEVERESRPLFACTYLAMDALEDPMNGTTDILKFVAGLAASTQQRLRFYYVWQAIQRGEDITDKTVQASIDAAVASHAAGSR